MAADGRRERGSEGEARCTRSGSGGGIGGVGTSTSAAAAAAEITKEGGSKIEELQTSGFAQPYILILLLGVK